MKTCKFCQEPLEDKANFCPNCGKPVDEQEAAEPEVQENAVTEQREEGASAPVSETSEAAAAEPEAQENAVTEQQEEGASAPVSETSEAAADEPTKPEEEAPAQPEQEKASPGKIALAAAAVVVLAAALIALIVSGLNGKKEDMGETVPGSEAVETTAAEATIPPDGNPEDVTCKGSYTVSDEEALAARDTVIATIGDKQLTNGELQTYYWSMVNSYLSSEYGYYLMMYGMLDHTQPLDTQFSTEEENLTWQQYFLKEGLNYWQLSTALAEEARKEGYTVSRADQEYLDNLPTSLEETAATYNMTVEELMHNNIGPGGTLEDFLAFQRLYCEGKDFYQDQLKAMVPTQEQLEAFYEEHAEGYEQSGITKDGKYVDVRHILVKVEGGTTDENGVTTYSEEEWAECQEKAQKLLDSWLAGEKTEDSFAALANEASEDPGSNTNGGLYEKVYVGQMVEPFENWCFDESRAYGDYGLVQTSYGYHVMFYVGSEPMWVSYVESDWVQEQSNALLATMTAGYPMDVDYENIVLGYISLG